MFSPEVPAKTIAMVLASYGLERGEYLLFPAHTWHHKNHRAAIDALRMLRDRHGIRAHARLHRGRPRGTAGDRSRRSHGWV